MQEKRKVIFSGMQPTGLPSLGNYLGAIKNWALLQNEYDCLYCIVDMHSITVRQNPAELRKKSRELLTLYIAAGLDPSQNIIYYQSHVSAHAELAWILNCFTYVGELNRMTQYKEKSLKHAENINAGLFTYPVLMAADILLFNTDLVPIGDDQKQHLELSRDIAIRFNNIYGDVFKVPEAFYGKAGTRIMNLQDPLKKMSKSEDGNDNSVIFLLDDPKVIMNKVKRAVTDSENNVRFSLDKPGISNLLNIYSAVKGKTIAELEKEFSGVGYGDFKEAVGCAIVDELAPIQKKYLELSQNKEFIDNIIKQNTEKANYLASKILTKVKKKIGFAI